MKIGNLEIKGPAALAPMAGVTDAAFRRVCADIGAAYTVTEMISSRALDFNDRKSLELCDLSATRARYSSRYLETTPPAWAVPRRRWRRSPRRVLT